MAKVPVDGKINPKKMIMHERKHKQSNSLVDEEKFCVRHQSMFNVVSDSFVL